MGLDTTHNAWHGPYSSFNDFRRAVLKAYNGTDLFDYAGYESRNKLSPHVPLLDIDDDGILLLCDHSDCDGHIRWVDCKLVADSLSRVLPKLDQFYKDKCQQFIDGCLLAYNSKENLEFR